jgi:hypothetical protein
VGKYCPLVESQGEAVLERIAVDDEGVPSATTVVPPRPLSRLERVPRHPVLFDTAVDWEYAVPKRTEERMRMAEMMFAWWLRDV